MLGFENDGGFWLVHSAPKFPNNPTGGVYTGQNIHVIALYLVHGIKVEIGVTPMGSFEQRSCV